MNRTNVLPRARPLCIFYTYDDNNRPWWRGGKEFVIIVNFHYKLIRKPTSRVHVQYILRRRKEAKCSIINIRLIITTRILRTYTYTHIICLRCGGIVPSCVLLHILRSLFLLLLTPFQSRKRVRTLYNNIYYTIYRTRRIYTAPAAGVTFVPTRNVWCTPTCLRLQLHGLFPAAFTDRPTTPTFFAVRILYIIMLYFIRYFRVIIKTPDRTRTEINPLQKP